MLKLFVSCRSSFLAQERDECVLTDGKCRL